MNAIALSDFRYTRNLARAYRTSLDRQERHPQPWREAGLDTLVRDLHAALDWWICHHRDGERIYRRATQ